MKKFFRIGVIEKMLQIVPALMAIVAFSACTDSDDGDDVQREITLYDIVELAEHDGSNFQFEVYKPDAVEPAVLTATIPSADFSDVKVGECLFLAYVPQNGQAYTSDRVDVKAFASITNSDIKKSTPENLTGWDSDSVYLLSLWRAGNKVCIRFRLTYDSEPRQFALVADETTLNDEYPTAYLYCQRKGSDPNFSRQYYAAFDVSNLWELPGCKGVKIRVNNSNLPEMTCFTVENPFSGGAE